MYNNQNLIKIIIDINSRIYLNNEKVRGNIFFIDSFNIIILAKYIIYYIYMIKKNSIDIDKQLEIKHYKK